MKDLAGPGHLPLRRDTYGHLCQAVLLNLPFLLAHPDWPLVREPVLRSWLINCVLFVLPGLPLVEVALRRGVVRRFIILWLIAGSLVASLVALLSLHLLGISVSGGSLWNASWIAMGIGILWNAAVGGPTLQDILATKPGWRAGVGVFVVSYGLCFFGASRVVPILGDQDDETQGTAHGLLVHLKPALHTGRGTDYLFAHPPLLHFYVAQALTYNGLLEEMAAFDSQEPNGLSAADAYARFRQSPHLVETRTPSVFFTALTVTLLATWIGTMAGAWWFGVLAAFSYATIPEVFVRSAYAGYFAIGGFMALQMLLALEQLTQTKDRDARLWALLAGALAALSDHKLLLLPLAIVVWDFWRRRTMDVESSNSSRRLHPIAAGFLLGTALFWIYGFIVSPSDFWMDHVRHHLVDRVINYNARGLDMSKYPELSALWMEFWRDSGFVLLPLGTAVMLLQVVRNGWSATAGAWLWWVSLSALAFSIVDWKQTKHLAPLLLPLVLAATTMANSRIMRRAVGVLLVGCLAWNASVIHILTIDFSVIVKVPEW